MSKTLFNPAILLRQSAYAALAIAVLSPVAVAAQQTETEQPPAENTEADPELIVVTGSRIQRPDLEAAAPVTALNNDILTAAGSTSAGDIVQYVPALFGSTSSDLSATRGTLVGGSQLNLRALGSVRTLVLVNGRRHVAASSGTAIVDVDTIPSVLIERTEVLTGGASAVYGSDAVSGVVNYVLRRNLSGFEIDAQSGISERGDAARYFASGAWGIDLGGRGNITIAAQYRNERAISYGDRGYLRGNQRLDDDANPALRFQQGDLTPDLIAAGAEIGQTILLSSGSPRYAITPASLLDRARNAPPRAFLPQRTFSISSANGLIGFDPSGGFFADLLPTDFDGNGVDDCSQTYNFRSTGFGCWVVDGANGRVRPFRDGLIAGFANQFGGDGIPVFLDNEDILPQIEQVNVNLVAHYEVSSAFRPFVEAKFVRTNAAVTNNVNSFNDTIPIALDNPFIPAELLAAAQTYLAANPGDAATAQFIISRDNTDFGANRDLIERDTYRIVVGAEGDIASNWRYEVSFNYGRTDETFTTLNRRLEDRFYAAVDAVRDPVTGRIVCRSSINPNRIPGTSPFPAYDADPDGDGIFEPVTFATGDGTCRPLNLFGLGSPSAEAVAFVNPSSTSRSSLEQVVVQGFIAGTTEGFFTLPGGAPGIVIGGEYRREDSSFVPDPLDEQGLFYESGTQGESGNYSLWEVFGELDVPIVRDVPFFHELTVRGAARYSRYNLPNLSGVFTWGVDGAWAPIRDIRFRGSYSRAVRAPNITELFGPVTPATFRPIDVCDAGQINLGPNPAVRLANCRADGIPAGFTDPLTARITGETGGNPNLEEERSTSWTAGVVLEPTFLPGFSVTVDYWNYEITNAIQAVAADDIVAGCYDSPDFPNNGFCQLFTRNRTPGSPTFLGFNSFRSGSVNFARFVADGVDFQANYRFNITDNVRVDARIGGTWNNSQVRFTSPTDPNSDDEFVGEAQVPEWAFSTGLALTVGGIRAEWQSFWQSAQFFQGIEVEDGNTGFAQPNRTEPFWSHNLSFLWEVTEAFSARFGVQNLTDERPFAAEAAYPVSARGRSYFLGVTANF
jgi:outer membrane receptor protein involved in Fe transport